MPRSALLASTLLAGLLASAPLASGAPVALHEPDRALPSEPDLAVAPGGRAAAVFWRSDARRAPQGHVVELAVRNSAGTRWREPLTLSRQTVNRGVKPKVAINARGLVAAIWPLEGRGTQVRVLRRGERGLGALRTFGERSARITSVDIGVDRAGNAHAMWLREPFPIRPNRRRGEVRLAIRSTGSGAWSQPRTLSPQGATAPRLAVSSGGAGATVWERRGGVVASYRPPGEAYSAGVSLSSPGLRTARRPNVALDGGGGAIAVWYEGAGERARVMFATRAARGGWSAPTALSEPGTMPVLGRREAPAITIGGAGVAVVAWRQVAGGVLSVHAAVRPRSGGDFSRPLRLSPLSRGGAEAPSVSVANSGDAVVAWAQANGRTQRDIRARSLQPGTPRFRGLRSLSTPRNRGSAPTVGLDARGRGTVVWRELVPGQGRAVRADRAG